jgi:hypothetical protein
MRNHVHDPASLLVTRRAKLAKTDGIDVERMQCALGRYLRFSIQPAGGGIRSTVALDSATWWRARGWAIRKALITLVQLRDTKAIEAGKQRQIIGDVLDDHSRTTERAE